MYKIIVSCRQVCIMTTSDYYWQSYLKGKRFHKLKEVIPCLHTNLFVKNVKSLLPWS